MAEVSRQDMMDAFQQLYDLLYDAYWKASNDEKDRIHGLEDAVYDILTALNQQDIEQRTAAFKNLAEKVSVVNGRLDKLRTEIDTIIHDVDVAIKVAKAIDSVASMAAKYFA